MSTHASSFTLEPNAIKVTTANSPMSPWLMWHKSCLIRLDKNSVLCKLMKGGTNTRGTDSSYCHLSDHQHRRGECPWGWVGAGGSEKAGNCTTSEASPWGGVTTHSWTEQSYRWILREEDPLLVWDQGSTYCKPGTQNRPKVTTIICNHSKKINNGFKSNQKPT